MICIEIEKSSCALEITALAPPWLDNKVRLEKNISSDFCPRNYKTGLSAAYGDDCKTPFFLVRYEQCLHALNKVFVFIRYLVFADTSVCSNVLITS